jgi:hypothetical protein
MKIKLKTNKDDECLEFCDIERFSDNSGYSATLVVHSRGFSAEVPFNFEINPLEKFIIALEDMNHTLHGKARLKPNYEDLFIELELDNLGHLRVRGEMIEYSHMPQCLKFEFETDQTCLEPFIHNLKMWQKIPST